MNINNSYNNLYFGQKVPTSSLLKMGSGIYSYDDAKNLCNSFDKKFPGHVGYYKKAMNYIEVIGNKNPHVRNILNNICYLQGKNKKLDEISRMTKELGQEIDVVI